MSASQKRKAGRRRSGNSIAEFGPGLIVLLIFFFFPLVDLISLIVSYGLVMVLNYNQLHEASLVPANQAKDPNGSVMRAIPEQWENGMGHFVKMSGKPVTTVTYRAGSPPDQIVNVVTTVVCNPFLPVPLPFVAIPGMNAPISFSYTSMRVMENPDYVNAQPDNPGGQ